MRIREGSYLDFQDVLLVPQRSSLDTRAAVDLDRTFNFRYGQKLICCPVIAANLDTVGTFAMAKALAKHKMLTTLNKHYSVEQLVDFFKDNEDIWNYVFYTLGTSDDDLSKLLEVAEQLKCYIPTNFPRMLCLDAANGYTGTFAKGLKRLRELWPTVIIMAGNVATGNMTEELLLLGADIVKVGIGSGALCETRIKTGVGVPQLTATDLCAYQAHGLNGYVCSDGGITCVGDICKAFAAGADFVMAGGLFGGTDECEGEWTTKFTMEDVNISTTHFKEIKFLKIHGMSSKAAMDKYNGGVASHRTSEGREVEVAYKGPVSDLVQDIKGGLASCCTYIGCLKIKDMPKCAEFIKVRRQFNDSLMHK